MEILAKDLKKGDRVKPFIDEHSLIRTKKVVTILGDMQECEGAFAGIYVMFPMKNGKKDDVLFIHPDETVELIDK